MGIEVFKKHLREKRIIKIDAKGNNQDLIAKICRCAQSSKASAIDISGIKASYSTARRNTKLPLIVSSVHPFEILEAVKMGVDGVQIGNYESIYKNKKQFNADEIYDTMLETMSLINDYDVFTIATIPANLAKEEQINLVKKLQLLGVDLFQTEGYKKAISKDSIITESPENSIACMTQLRKEIGADFIVSCITDIQFARQAFDNGACGITISNNQIANKTEAGMQVEMMEYTRSISHRNSLNREIIRTNRELLNY